MPQAITAPSSKQKILKWNRQEMCEARLQTCKTLLANDLEAFYLIPNFTSLLPGFDTDLADCDLNWRPDFNLLVRLWSTEKPTQDFKASNPGVQRCPHIYVDCRVFTPSGSWASRIRTALHPGDFRIILSTGGQMEQVVLRKTPPRTEHRREGIPTRLHISNKEGKDYVQLLSESYGEVRVSASAEAADLVLALLRQRGPGSKLSLPESDGTPLPHEKSEARPR